MRKGRVLEASIIGGALTLGATFFGGYVAHSGLAHYFNLTGKQVMLAMAAYGFIASVLPVWVLLCPRDYLSSFLKIGTIALLVGGTMLANPKLEAPALNHVFAAGGPVVSSGSPNLPARIFPFLFICIMCGAISGFHALVSSGTTPKMIQKESDARTIGYGAMLVEALVGVVAMVAAATLPVGDYYAMNVDLAQVPAYHDRILSIPGGGIEHIGQYEELTQESLRGRTGGAVTLAVGMAHIFDEAAGHFWKRGGAALRSMWKYWYHFAIMFEALFILTTIDTGTRIGRFLLQEVAGKWVHPKLGEAGWWPGAILSTLLIVVAWTYFLSANSMAAIWPMFGVANQMLAVIALAVISVYLVNEGKGRYLWVTVLPMLVVATTTTTAAAEMLSGLFDGLATQWQIAPTARDGALIFKTSVEAALILSMLACGAVIIIAGAIKVWGTMNGESRGSFVPALAADARV
jgi:carbon starvation protein